LGLVSEHWYLADHKELLGKVPLEIRVLLLVGSTALCSDFVYKGRRKTRGSWP